MTKKNHSIVLREGATGGEGSDVHKLLIRLKAIGYHDDEITQNEDGKYELTAGVVENIKVFQKEHGLVNADGEPDGIAGKDTLRVLTLNYMADEDVATEMKEAGEYKEFLSDIRKDFQRYGGSRQFNTLSHDVEAHDAEGNKPAVEAEEGGKTKLAALFTEVKNNIKTDAMKEQINPIENALKSAGIKFAVPGVGS